MTDTNAAYHTEVLVVGAGPVGLALAIELGRLGIKVLSVEQNERVGVQPRAKTTNVRSMEHMRRWGIAERIRAASPLPADYPTDIVFATRLFSHPLVRIENAFYGARTKNDLFSESAQWIPQYTVEGVLRDHALSLPSVELRFNTRLTNTSQSVDGVVGDITDIASGKTAKVHARYLVAADGARSDVRGLLGIEMTGQHAYAKNCNVIFRAPGLGNGHPQSPAIMYWLVNPEAPAVVGPMDRGDTWFFMMALGNGNDDVDSAAARQMVLRALGRDWPVDVLVYDLWAAHSLIADRYRAGRIFLAGDACHLHPPYGGYGMNLGIGDAVDLGWKLAAVLRGWGGEKLLDSYERERRPVDQRVINEAVENYTALPRDMLTPDIEAQSARGDTARQRLGAAIGQQKLREFKTLGVVLGYHYSGSPIVVPDGSAPPEEHFTNYQPSAHPGCLAPHLWLPDDTSLYDHFGRGFTLLVTSAGAERDMAGLEEAARAAHVPLKTIAPGDGRLRDLYGARLVLIRPDQHVAWRGDGLDRSPAAILDCIRGV